MAKTKKQKKDHDEKFGKYGKVKISEKESSRIPPVRGKCNSYPVTESVALSYATEPYICHGSASGAITVESRD